MKSRTAIINRIGFGICLLLMLACNSKQSENKAVCLDVAEYYVKINMIENRKDSIDNFINRCSCMMDKNPTYQFQFLVVGKRYDEAKSLLESLPDSDFKIKDQSKNMYLNFVNSLIFHSQNDTLSRDSCVYLMAEEIENVIVKSCDVSAVLNYIHVMSVFRNKSQIVSRMDELLRKANCSQIDSSVFEDASIFEGKKYYNIQ